MPNKISTDLSLRKSLPVLVVLLLIPIACYTPALPPLSPTIPVNQSDVNITITAIAAHAITVTPSPGVSPTPTVTDTPIIAAPPLRATYTPTPTATMSPNPPTAQFCDQFKYVADITVEDGKTYSSGERFTKTWRVRNSGTCTWTPEYALVFESGNNMSGPAVKAIGQYVLPGQTVDVSVVLQAPGEPGTYRGYWRLRNAANTSLAGSSFYVEIQAVTPSPTPKKKGLDFISQACHATWQGNEKELPCFGRIDDPDGYVVKVHRPIFENGYVDDDPALLTYPPREDHAIIRGTYAPYTVQPGDHFYTIVGCQVDRKNCNVRFQFEYQIDDGPIQTLAVWNETNDSQFTPVDLDLSSLTGKTVKFILTVSANGPADMDRAIWLLPRIQKAE